VVIFAECSLEPRRVDRGFHPYRSGTRKCGVTLLGLTVLVFKTPFDHLARRGTTIAIC
jgi:hypothetical protein